MFVSEFFSFDLSSSRLIKIKGTDKRHTSIVRKHILGLQYSGYVFFYGNEKQHKQHVISYTSYSKLIKCRHDPMNSDVIG